MCSHQSVAEFRDALTAESAQLSGFCISWRQVLDIKSGNEQLNEDILGDIRLAIGQAELLKKKRFSQFSNLIDDCEFKRGEKETTVQDLQGFWDIIYFQVDDIIRKFAALDKLRNNNWQTEECIQPAASSKPVIVKKSGLATAARKPRPAMSSALRAHILAARSKLNKASDCSTQLQATLPSPAAVLQPRSPATTNTAAVASASCKRRLSTHGKENVEQATTTSTTITTPPHTRQPEEDVHKLSERIEASDLLAESPKKEGSIQEVSTFNAGFFQIQTPTKAKFQARVVQRTPLRTPAAGAEQALRTRVLSSSLLKERVAKTPVTHKDYSPCMRITRSMKKVSQPWREDE